MHQEEAMQALLSLQSDTLLRLCVASPHLLFAQDEDEEDGDEDSQSPRSGTIKWSITTVALLLRQHAPWSILELLATLIAQVEFCLCAHFLFSNTVITTITTVINIANATINRIQHRCPR